MKKLLVMALCAAIIGSFAACSEEKPVTEVPASANTVAEGAETEQPAEETKANTEETAEAAEQETENIAETEVAEETDVNANEEEASEETGKHMVECTLEWLREAIN